jgi:hypothetical protein
VAPPIAAQSAPFACPPDRGQRTHWKAKLVGAFVHDPVVAVRVEPTVAVPEIRGSAVLAGRCWVTAPLPAGRARIVASDASAAVSSVETMVVRRRVVRIAGVLSVDDTPTV